MLRSLTALSGNRLQSADVVFGEVADLLFDDRDWRIRYIVASTRRWLGRSVLIPMHEVRTPESAGLLPVALTRDEIRAGLPLEQAGSDDRPLATELHSRFGWFPLRAGSVPPATYSRMHRPVPSEPAIGPRDYHLCSARDTGEYVVESIEGNSGYLENLVLDDESWVIRYLVVVSGDGLRQGRTFVPIDRIRAVRHLEGKILTGVWREPFTETLGIILPESKHRKSQREVFHNPLNDFNGRTRFWV